MAGKNPEEEITWEEMRERDGARLQECGGVEMMEPELISYFKGHPPLDQCIATPPALHKAILSGDVAPENSPLGRALSVLSEKFPDVDLTPVDHLAEFAASAAAKVGESVAENLDHLFNLDGGPK